MKLNIALATLAFSVTACVTVGRPLDLDKVGQIKKDVTTREQVIALLGQPNQVSRDGNNNLIFNYSYVKATPKAASFIPVVGMFAGGTNMENQMLIVTIDPTGVVKNTFSTIGGMESSFGANTNGADSNIDAAATRKDP